ncbi:hypothetical protein PAMP_022620 [Pampus punctatissimus]
MWLLNALSFFSPPPPPSLFPSFLPVPPHTSSTLYPLSLSCFFSLLLICTSSWSSTLFLSVWIFFPPPPLSSLPPAPSAGRRKLVDCPQLLDVDDMVKMREPDWKCVYTYLQEFYRGLVTKGLVKTKNSS